MTDSIRVFEPGFQVTNALGVPQSGAVIRFYEAGTSTPRTVYSNLGLSTSLGTTVTTNSAGRPAASAGAGAEVLVYTGINPYKVSAETSLGVTLWGPFDNVVGALDTSSFSAISALPETPVQTKTGDYVVVVGDKGNVINVNSASDCTVTLPSAVTMGDGWRITIRNVHASTQVSIITVGGQTVQGQTSHVLRNKFDGACLVSDAANWHLDGYSTRFVTGQLPFFTIVDRDLTTAPASPDPGARYIVAGIGGGWSAFDIDDVVEADGQGGWIEYDPDDGWLAWVEDEDRTIQFRANGWRFISGQMLLATGSSSAAATLEIDLSNYTAFRSLTIELYGVVPSTDGADLQIRFSTDGGGSYIASGYNYALTSNVEGTAADEGSGSTNDIKLANNVGSGAAEGYNGTVKLSNQASTTFWPRVTHAGYHIDNQATPGGVHSVGGGSNESSMDVNAVRLLFSAGNITLTYAVYGML